MRPAKLTLHIKCILLCLCVTTPGFALELRVCEEADWPPYTYELTGTPSKGVALELMQALSTKLNWQLDIQLNPFKRCVKMMETGERDAISVISKSNNRDEIMVFSLPLIHSWGLLYHINNFNVPDWESPEDLSHLRLVAVGGHNLGDAFNEAVNKKSLNIQMVKRSEQGFELLLRGRADVFLLNKTSGDQILTANKSWKEKIDWGDKSFEHYDYRLGVSRKSPLRHSIDDINNAINELHDSGAITKILKKYNHPTDIER